MPWYFYASMIVLALIAISFNPLVIQFAWDLFYPEQPEPKESYHRRFEDGDFELRENADGSTSVEWRKAD